jgi:hypothetical protein
MKKMSDKEDMDVYVYCFVTVTYCSFCAYATRSCVLLYCCSFFASHTLHRVVPLQSSGCANDNVTRLQIRNGDSDCAVGQWMMITIHI